MGKTIQHILLLACAVVAPAWSGTGCAGDRYHRSTGDYVDDRSITSRVKSALLADKAVSGFDVKGQTYEGMVQLSGFVDSRSEKERAGELARDVHGVRTAKNDLIVKAPESRLQQKGKCISLGPILVIMIVPAQLGV